MRLSRGAVKGWGPRTTGRERLMTLPPNKALSSTVGIVIVQLIHARGSYREALADYITEQAKPLEKLSHQPRLYRLARRLAEDQPYDDEVLYAAAWLHDLGVFIGHRPQDPVKLARWDHVAYAVKQAPGLLKRFGFPAEKIPAVLEVIRNHLPSAVPVSFEAVLLRDADILEQLGAIGILRTVSKVGRDTRFIKFSDALRVLRQNARELPERLRLPSARKLAEPRVRILRAFLEAAKADGTEW